MAFQRAIRGSDVPEQGVAKGVVGLRDIAVGRSGGSFYAVDGSCTHEAGPLGEGSLEGEELVCPWHEGGYNIRTGEANPETDWVTDVKSFPVRVEDDCVSVDL